MSTFTYQRDDQPYTITLDRLPDGRYQATIGDRAYTFEAVRGSDGTSTLRFTDAESARIAAAGDGETRYVQVNGQPITLERTTLQSARIASPRKSSGGPTSGTISAQMPGQVREVSVSVGDAVKRGQTLLVLEAMKMETRITAPADGAVQQVWVQVGLIVERGQRLIELG